MQRQAIDAGINLLVVYDTDDYREKIINWIPILESKDV